MKEIKAIMYTDGTVEEYSDYERNAQRKTEYINKKKSEDASHKFIDGNFGSFYFNNYNKLLAKDLDPQMLFRFTYLCTFMDFENVLRFGATDGVMVEKDLQEVLGLGKTQFFETKKVLLDSKLLISNDLKELSINKSFCSKGETKKIFLDKGVIRMFEDGIKKLYENSNPKDHKKLGLLIKILPYLHVETNVLCHNPNEVDIELVSPITLTEMSEILEFSTTQKLKKGLFDLKVDNCPVIMNSIINGVRKIVINPKVYYKGSNIEQMKGLINLFMIGNKL